MNLFIPDNLPSGWGYIFESGNWYILADRSGSPWVFPLISTPTNILWFLWPCGRSLCFIFFIILSNQNFDFLLLENLSDWPHVLQSSVITTIGFVKGAPDIDVQGFNVYHKNRLISVRALLCMLHGAWCFSSLFFPLAVCCQ